ncbi:MAG: hypothetical protein ACLT4C_03200 [Butyricicoccus sp.]
MMRMDCCRSIKTVYYDSTAANRLSELQSLLTKECGVPAERQELIAR